MSSLLIKNGHLIDPKNGIDGVRDVLIESGKVAKVAKSITAKAGNGKTIDAKGLIVTPGLIDGHVHFREPGREDRETLETGARAALAGGVTSAVAMPNSTPVADNQTVVEFVVKRARELDLINIYPAGAVTRNQDGAMIAEMNELKRSGAIAVTDDGFDVQHEGILRRALEYATTCELLLMSHCETTDLTEGGAMHEGWVSTQLGLPGIPALSEDMAVYKNVLLAESVGARLHVLHTSTEGAVRAVREAKKRGAKHVTAEVTVQHIALTDEACAGYDTNAKMYPPLRSKEHVKAVIKAIKDDVVDVLASDHAPHIQPDKLKPFQDAAFGTVGLETLFAVMNTYLAAPGHITLAQGIKKMTQGPAEVLGLDKGHLSIGADADIAIFDPKHTWTVDPDTFFSKARNSVFADHELTGKAMYTIVGGRVKYKDGKVVA